ncbi:hypothetical protein HDU97_004211 [Phlyctochytrium planicorne]|nr:hypothetical protein HDU97_004211 [Phlyctochytrium planicorne]
MANPNSRTELELHLEILKERRYILNPLSSFLIIQRRILELEVELARARNGNSSSSSTQVTQTYQAFDSTFPSTPAYPISSSQLESFAQPMGFSEPLGLNALGVGGINGMGMLSHPDEPVFTPNLSFGEVMATFFAAPAMEENISPTLSPSNGPVASAGKKQRTVVKRGKKVVCDLECACRVCLRTFAFVDLCLELENITSDGPFQLDLICTDCDPKAIDVKSKKRKRFSNEVICKLCNSMLSADSLRLLSCGELIPLPNEDVAVEFTKLSTRSLSTISQNFARIAEEGDMEQIPYSDTSREEALAALETDINCMARLMYLNAEAEATNMRDCPFLSTWDKIFADVVRHESQITLFLRGQFDPKSEQLAKSKNILRYVAIGFYPDGKSVPSKKHGYDVGGFCLVQWNVTDASICFFCTHSFGLNALTQSAMLPHLIESSLVRIDRDLKANPHLKPPKHVWCSYIRRENKGARSAKASVKRLELIELDTYVKKHNIPEEAASSAFNDFCTDLDEELDRISFAIEWERCLPFSL